MSEIVELRDVESAWARLRTHLEWADSFWLLFVFSNDPRTVEALCERTATALGERSSFRAWRCGGPDEVDAMVDAILGEAPIDVHWIDLVRFDDRHGQPGWGAAWGRMLQRLNERRELLRRRAPKGGLVFASTLDRLESSAGFAPDLWTIRSLVFRIESLPRAGRELDVMALMDGGEERRESSRNVTLARQAVSAARASGDEGRLAQALSALADATLEEEAVAIREEAVAIYRRLLQASPTVEARVALGGELLKLSEDLRTIGRRELALEAALETVQLARALADTEPEPYLSCLAMSLSNLGTTLGEVGRSQEALTATQEAVDLFRELVARVPEEFAARLALALNNLGNRLWVLDHHEDALAAAQEAVRLRRALAEGGSEGSRVDLAVSLNNLSNVSGTVGRSDEALAAAEEAVELVRELAQARPEVFRPRFAAILVGLAVDLRDAGRLEEALVVAEESVELHRKLAQARPAVFLRGLARSFGALGHILFDLGRLERATLNLADALRTAHSVAATQPWAVESVLPWLAQLYLHACEQANIPPAEDLAPILAQFPPTES